MSIRLKTPTLIGSRIPKGTTDNVLYIDSNGKLAQQSYSTLAGNLDHGNLTAASLLDDDHTQYALLAGRSGGQTLIGGTASGNDLTLQSTSHATKGKILFGTSAYDEVNNRLGIGKSTPGASLDVPGDLRVGYSDTFAINSLSVFDGILPQVGFGTTALYTGGYNFVVGGVLTSSLWVNAAVNNGYTTTPDPNTVLVMGLENPTNGGYTFSGYSASTPALMFSGFTGSQSPTGATTYFNNFKRGSGDTKTGLASSEKMIEFQNANNPKVTIYGNGDTWINNDDVGLILGAGSDAKIDYDSGTNNLDIDLTGGVNTGLRILSDGGTLSLNGSTGDWLLAGADKFQFGDSGTYIAQLTDGHLDLTADVSIDLNGVVEITDDTYWVGAGSGIPYGGIYAKDANTEITISGTGEANKVQITSFSANGTSNLTTPDHTNDHITISKTGEYVISATLSIDSVAGGGGDFGFEIYKNNGATGFDNIHANRDLAGGMGETGSVTLIGHAALTAGDTVELWVWNETNTNNIVINDVNLTVRMIGG